MSAVIDLDEALEQFDSLDLESVTQRRLAAYALREYYGSVLTTVGYEFLNIDYEFLNFQRDFRNASPKYQWINIKNRLGDLQDFTVPDEYKGLVQKVHEISNNVDHDFSERPTKDSLEDARAKAEEWHEWLMDSAKAYRDIEEELDVRDTVIRITRHTLEGITPSTVREGASYKRQEILENRADELLSKLDKIEEETRGVTKELVFLLVDAKELEAKDRRLDECEQVGMHYRHGEIQSYLEDMAQGRGRFKNF